jgi:hypothetical protein
MPNMQRLTWSGIALHGGPLPGHAASHGCVRLPYDFAQKLFDKTPMGMRVIIAPNDAEPVEFSDLALLVPNAAAIAAAPGHAETLANEAAEAAKIADEAKGAAATAAAQSASKAAEVRRADAAKAAREAKLALEPVSLFISRSTQRLYVRRGFEVGYAVPVTIRNSDKPIGTHVFTAVGRADGGLRWTAVTIDSGDDAKSALDRIKIPQDVLDRIAPTALPRSSLVISDEPLNRETKLSHGVRCGTEQPATGRSCDAPASGRSPRRGPQRLG